jgi:hypothetical protein
MPRRCHGSTLGASGAIWASFEVAHRKGLALEIPEKKMREREREKKKNIPMNKPLTGLLTECIFSLLSLLNNLPFSINAWAVSLLTNNQYLVDIYYKEREIYYLLFARGSSFLECAPSRNFRETFRRGPARGVCVCVRWDIFLSRP